MTAVQALRLVRARAGCPAADHPIYFANDPTSTFPPTLQRVNHKGKPMKNRRGGKLRGFRRIIVGRKWLEQRMPEVVAALVASILLGDGDFFPPTVPANHYSGVGQQKPSHASIRREQKRHETQKNVVRGVAPKWSDVSDALAIDTETIHLKGKS